MSSTPLPQQENKHTPGPWTIYNDPESGKNAYGVEAFTNRGSTKGIVILMNRGLEETESNAALIACAPEMLEALKEAATALRFADGLLNEEAHGVTKSRITHSLLTINSLISKAEQG